MIDLRALGALDLRRREGPELHSVLAQPKRTALLCYLALARPRGFHRRDSLVALFWPEHDTEHARASLRQATHFLRRSLGEDAILSRGDEDIGLGDGVLCCDAVQFDAALDANEPERALALYGGDLLPGFFVDEAPDFERWLEAERTRLRERAIRACWSMAELCEQTEERAAAAEWGRRAIAIAPADDSQIIRLMQCLARSGDRAGALAAFDAYARRLRSELEVEPTAAAQAVAEQIREVEPPATTPPTGLHRRAGSGPRGTGAHAAAGETPAQAQMPETGVETAAISTETASRVAEPIQPAPAPQPLAPTLPGNLAVPVRTPADRRLLAFRSRRSLVAAGLLTLVIATGWVVLRFRASPLGATGPGPDQIAVLYFRDLAPSGADRGLADMITLTLIDQFSTVPGLKVISAPGVEPYRDARLPADSIGRALKVGTLVSGSVERAGSAIRVRVELINAADARVVETRVIERPVGQIPPLVDDVVREAAVFLRKRIGEAVLTTSRPAGVSDKGWSFFQLARHARSDGSELLGSGELAAALAGFRRADSLFALAEREDPDWVRPTVERAWTADRIAFVRGMSGTRDTLRRRQAVESGIAHATRALARHPGDATALEVRSALKDHLWMYSARHGPRGPEMLASAEADAGAAVAANQHLATAWRTLALARWQALNYMGAQAAARRALEEDAYASESEVLWIGYQSAFQLGQEGRAREWCDEFRRRNRDQGVAAACALQLLAWGDAPPDVAAAARIRREFGGHDAPQNDVEMQPTVDLALAAVLARAGLRDSAEALIARATQRFQPPLLRWEAEARVLLHQDDAAIRLLSQYLLMFPDQRPIIARDRCYAPIRNLPAFVAITQVRRQPLDR